ncbi:MAG: ROK family protein [Bacteroidales bacterium]|nr:ROK family protein [Bacteroidales bacterium]
MSQTFAIGIDIGGTNTDLGLVRSDGECLTRLNFPTTDCTTADTFVERLCAAIGELLEKSGSPTLLGIGIGAPNGNSLTGCIEEASNLPQLSNLPLKQILEERLHLPVAVGNDANAAALGEMVYGGAKDLQDFVTITLGTGVGSGIVINRRLLLGVHGNAGEIGHSILVPDGRLCSCGRRGCVEEYASARGICKTFAELRQAKGSYNGMLDGFADNQLSPKLIAEAAQQGDALSIETFERTGYYLGLACANVVSHLAPQKIFLMGGPTQAGSLLMNPTRKSFDDNLLSIYKGQVKIELTHLRSNDAAILGAAALINL